jgi:hypothetical protein
VVVEHRYRCHHYGRARLRIVGISKDQKKVTFETLSKNIHPADLERVRSAFAATRAAIGAYEIDFRILSGRDIRWISARGQGDEMDRADRTTFGVFLGRYPTKARRGSQRASGGRDEPQGKEPVAYSDSTYPDHVPLGGNKRGNGAGIIEPPDGTRPGTGPRSSGLRPQNEGALLGDLISILLAPYDEKGASVRIRVFVPKMSVGETSSTTLALVIHELATNAAKYGALSVASGTLDVSCTAHDDQVALMWTERGGPPVVMTAMPEGFGSKLVRRTMAAQFGGTIGFDWSTEGVVITLRMSKVRLAT